MIYPALICAFACCVAAYLGALTNGQLTISLAVCALIAASKTPKLRVAAFMFVALLAFNYWWLGKISGAEYGANKFLACAVAECLIMLSAIFVRHLGARWLCITSAALCIAHLLAALSYRFPVLNVFYDIWDGFIPAGEVAQSAGIIIFSNPIWAPLLGWYSRRQASKESTWLANWIPALR